MLRPASARGWATQAEAFGRHADSTSRLHRTLSRRAGSDPLVGKIVAEALSIPRGNVALRLYGAVHYLVLAGRAPAYAQLDDPWPVFRAILETHEDWIRTFVTTQPVQTNEPQRSWALLPAFLTACDSWSGPVDLIELGASAGLNLRWDRFGYRYVNGTWGDPGSLVVLGGVEIAAVPAAVLKPAVTVRRRVGIDQAPVDPSTDHGARLLEAFVWADDPERLDRVRRAIEVARSEPVELIAGDIVDVVCSHLGARDDDALTIVFDSNATEYLEDERYQQLERAICAHLESGNLAWVSMERPRGSAVHPYVVTVSSPGHPFRRTLAETHHHGADLAWIGGQS